MNRMVGLNVIKCILCISCDRGAIDDQAVNMIAGIRYNAEVPAASVICSDCTRWSDRSICTCCSCDRIAIDPKNDTNRMVGLDIAECILRVGCEHRAIDNQAVDMVAGIWRNAEMLTAPIINTDNT